ncbi:MAG: tetratricopeptide repeat protein [Myxococcota bacterium]
MRIPVPFCTALVLAAAVSCGAPDPLATPSVAAPAAAAPAEDLLQIGPGLRGLALPLPPPVLKALREGRWADAEQGLRAMPLDALQGAQKSDWAFLVAWCATHGEHPEAAADVLTLLDDARAPAPYVALVRGEVLLATDKALDALAWLEKVGNTAVVAPRAALREADALFALGRTADARERLRPFGERADPADGNAEILLRLAEWSGIGSDEAYTLLRRVWTYYPGTPGDVAASRYLATQYAGRGPTWQEAAKRAEAWLDLGDWDAVLDLTTPILGQAAGKTADACRLRFAHGRALYKKNAVTDAAEALKGIGEDCKSIDETYGARGMYLLGTALYRRKRFAESAAAYRQLTDLYPDQSMADDGLTRGGISLLEAGRPDEARKWWEEALERFPKGDTVPEALLRLAFSRYLDGDPDDARAIAARLGGLPVDGDAVSVQAGRYWAARWRLYPDASAPNRASTDPAAKAEAIEGFAALCRDMPQSFYAIQAYSRLVEIAPDRAAALAKRPDDHDDGSGRVDWQVRLRLARDPHVRDGVALIRLGLPVEGLAEWRRADIGELRARRAGLAVGAADLGGGLAVRPRRAAPLDGRAPHRHARRPRGRDRAPRVPGPVLGRGPGGRQADLRVRAAAAARARPRGEQLQPRDRLVRRGAGPVAADARDREADRRVAEDGPRPAAAVRPAGEPRARRALPRRDAQAARRQPVPRARRLQRRRGQREQVGRGGRQPADRRVRRADPVRGDAGIRQARDGHLADHALPLRPRLARVPRPVAVQPRREAGVGVGDVARIGGEAAVEALVARFVRRMAADFVIGFQFQGKDLDRIAHHEAELALAHLGGRRHYGGRSLGEVHAPLRINRGQFRRRLAVLRATLEDEGVPSDVIERWIAHDQALEGAIAGPTDCLAPGR